MTNNEIEFLECLDKAVEWEKEKQIRLRKARKPFKKDEILKLMLELAPKKVLENLNQLKIALKE